MIFTLFIKGQGFYFLPPVLNRILPLPRVLTPKAQVRCFRPSIMSRSSRQGRWMPSSVTEEDIKKLREARYLTAEVSHWLPARGQVVPTPKPNEDVVFISHFLQGLDLTLDPFVRGLMFYYGLDFHDLAPDSFLHISAFIVVCEAFLRITPHFGLWLKTFDVKPKMVEGQHIACGGALISKIAGAPWPKGSFPEMSGLWQREWFYVTAPRSAKWVASPAFCSGPPP